MKSINTYIIEKLKVKGSNNKDKYFIKNYNDFCEYITKHYDKDKKYLDMSNISFDRAILDDVIPSRITVPMREFIRENKVETIDVSNWEFNNVPKLIMNLFSSSHSLRNIIGLDTWNVSHVTRLDNIFLGCSMLTDLSDIEDWDVSSCVSFEHMFDGCTRLKKLDLRYWKLPNVVKNITSMFARCTNLEEIKGLDKWNINNSLANYDSVFAFCRKLKELDLSNWRPKLSRSEKMFCDCRELTTIGDISNWDFSYDINTTDMFNGCGQLELDMSMCKMNISVTKVRMFKDANKKIKKPKFKP